MVERGIKNDASLQRETERKMKKGRNGLER
jgi:hypothetical protein